MPKIYDTKPSQKKYLIPHEHDGTPMVFFVTTYGCWKYGYWANSQFYSDGIYNENEVSVIIILPDEV